MGPGQGFSRQLRWYFIGLVLVLCSGATAAQASTLTDLQTANPGQQVALTDGATLTVGTTSTSGSVTTFSNASLDFGDVAGTGVAGELSGDTLTLTGGNFAVPGGLSETASTIDSSDPVVATFADGSVSDIDGGLTSTSQPVAAASAALVPDELSDGDVNAAVPAPAAGERYRIRLILPGLFDNGKWGFRVYLIRGGVEVAEIARGTTWNNTAQGLPRWRYEVDVNYPAIIQGKTVAIAGKLTGNNIFDPSTITGLSGSITGEIELTKGVFFTGGSVSWDASGFRLSGGARVNCAEGSVSAQLAGAHVNDSNWSLRLSVGTNNGCRVSKDLNIPSGNLTGEIKKVDGALTGLFEVGGTIQTALLPAGVNEWDAQFRFVYDGTAAGSHVAFSASAGIGTAQGKVNFDGTFALNADFKVPFGNSDVAFVGDIKRTAPDGPVVYDLGGSANIAVNSKTTVGGSVRLTNTTLSLAGYVELACPVSGTARGGVSGDIPLSSSRDWSLTISGGAGSNGCQVTKELGLASGSALSGQVKSVGGVVSVAANANATINTTLVPTKTSFTAGFAFAASQGNYSIAVNASTQGASFAGNVASDGTFALNADVKVPFGNSDVAFDGSIKRTAPDGPVVYDLGGSANIAVNSKTTVGGSVRLTNTTLSLAGYVELACPVSGTARGGVSGDIPLSSSRDWSLTISGGAGSNGCQVTKELGLASGSALSGQVKSVGGVVSVAANANATINTTLVPTKTSFTVGFAFAASRDAYRVAVNGSTQGASFSGDVASDGTFGLSFALSDLALGGVTLGAKGEIKRTSPGAAVQYSISGSLAGEAKIYDNLYLRGGSLSISSTGGLRFSGTVRQTCTSGSIDATVSGTIQSSRDWTLAATGTASWCSVGRRGWLDGNTFFGDIRSVDNKVRYSAGIRIAKLNLYSSSFLGFSLETSLENLSATISNSCSGCYESGKTRVTFGATGVARKKALFLLLKFQATVNGSVDITGGRVVKVSLFVAETPFRSEIERDTEKAFTT